jgi:hypothetical protein
MNKSIFNELVSDATRMATAGSKKHDQVNVAEAANLIKCFLTILVKRPVGEIFALLSRYASRA